MRIHMKYQALFSVKTNEKYLVMSSAAVLIGAIRVNSFEAESKLAELVSVLYSQKSSGLVSWSIGLHSL